MKIAEDFETVRRALRCDDNDSHDALDAEDFETVRRALRCDDNDSHDALDRLAVRFKS